VEAVPRQELAQLFLLHSTVALFAQRLHRAGRAIPPNALLIAKFHFGAVGRDAPMHADLLEVPLESVPTSVLLSRMLLLAALPALLFWVPKPATHTHARSIALSHYGHPTVLM
jgi:hypothetical protein